MRVTCESEKAVTAGCVRHRINNAAVWICAAVGWHCRSRERGYPACQAAGESRVHNPPRLRLRVATRLLPVKLIHCSLVTNKIEGMGINANIKLDR